MHLLIDMNLTPRWVRFLQDAGYEVVHWSSVSPNSAKDSEICDYARRCVYVILMNDLDFPQILAHAIVTLDWTDKPRARVLPLR
jgi:predicted nuclease of predicted toxin-antitoxin system